MNAMQQARHAYAGPQSAFRTPRQAEHHVFSLITARLAAAAKQPDNFPTIAAVLHDNRRLWTRIAIDLADKDNGLPADLRARIVYLAEFTVHHSARVLRGEAELQPLIEINTAIMRGLAGTAVAPGQVPQ